MFDIGFSELMVIGVVALLVIGPEKLPKVARTLGHLLGRAQRYVNDVKSDINREMQLDELKKLQSEVTESARALETSVRKEYESARAVVETPAQAAAAEVDSVVGQLNASLAEPAPVPAAQAAPVAMDAAVPPAAPVEAAGKSAA
ncbi:MAG: Sec-independent protein translocase protein TatB [Betaproteobacteria bacterium]|jgi:sec-independent protein translocase protein TatB